jgi:hypothetical protein
MAKARRLSKKLDLPSNATPEEIEDATTPYLEMGWSLIDTWISGDKRYIMLVKVITN